MKNQTGSIRQTLDNTAQWKIYCSSNGYVLQNRYTGWYLRMSTVNYDVEASTTITTQGRWTLDTPSIPNGIVLYDPQTFALVNTTGTLEFGSSLQAICMPLGQDTGDFTISENLVVNCSDDGVITGKKRGVDDVTVSASINGTLYQHTCRLTAYEVVEVDVIYDAAYAARYADYATRISTHTQALYDKYEENFYIRFDFSTPTQFTSLGDTCSTDYTDVCIHTCTEPDCEHICTDYGNCGHDYECWTCPNRTCQNSIIRNTGVHTEYEYHHRNAYNMLIDIDTSATVKKLAYTGHNICHDLEGVHYINRVTNGTPSNGYLFGVAAEVLGVALIADHLSVEHATFTTIHEFGHAMGAMDHYKEGYGTDKVNDAIHSDLFSSNCIYGEDFRTSTAVITDIPICEGCQKVINKEIPFPEMP